MQQQIYHLVSSNALYSKIIVLFFVLMCVVKRSNSFDYFKEKPSFIKSCKLSQPDLTKCSTEALQKMIKEVIKGVPEFRDVIGSLDPLVLKDIAFKQDGAEAVNILIGLSTLIVKDLSKVQVLENRVQRNDFSFLLKMRMPELRLTGHYKLDGRILLLSLKTEGEMAIDLEDVHITTLIKTDLFARDGYTFYNVTKVQNDINIGKLQAQFDNLFGGRNKELEQSILTTINENWREFFEVLRPSTTTVVDQITFDLLHKICLLIPAKYFLEDIPTPKQSHENISPNTL